MEQQPTPVPMAKQVGEVRSRWEWAEPSVWSERMLMALEQGVQGGVWFSDERRWPNAFLDEQGLFSLKAAQAKTVNPL